MKSHAGDTTEYPTNSQTSQNMKRKKSQLHDLLAEEALENSNGIDVGVPDSTLPLNDIVVQSELTNDGNFIEAKYTERGHISRLQMTANKAAKRIASQTLPLHEPNAAA